MPSSLVEPAGPLNIGSVARLCANFGVRELRLVAPRCDHLSDEAMLMAVHATLLQAAVVVPDLLTAINDCRRTVGSCGRLDHGEIPLQTPEQALLVAGQRWQQLQLRRPRGLGVWTGRPRPQQQ